jgi:hypothetical protein
MEIKADIIDYMGRIDDGVLVLLSITCDGEYSEATLFYNDEKILFTVDRSFEEKINSQIETWSGYKKLLESVLGRLVPAKEIAGRLDEVDFGQYVEDQDDYFIDEDDDLYEDDDYEDDEEDNPYEVE